MLPIPFPTAANFFALLHSEDSANYWRDHFPLNSVYFLHLNDEFLKSVDLHVHLDFRMFANLQNNDAGFVVVG